MYTCMYIHICACMFVNAYILCTRAYWPQVNIQECQVSDPHCLSSLIFMLSAGQLKSSVIWIQFQLILTRTFSIDPKASGSEACHGHRSQGIWEQRGFILAMCGFF